MRLQPTNYCSRAIDLFRETRNSAPGSDFANFLERRINQMQSAVKFRLPDFGNLLGGEQGTMPDFIKHVAQPFRIPYPIIACEFPHPNVEVQRVRLRTPLEGGVFDKTIALAWEAGNTDEAAIIVTSVSHMVSGGWAPSLFEVKLFSDGNATARQCYKTDTEEPLVSALDENQSEINAIVQLIAALSCSNVSVVATPAPNRLNKRRKKKGQQPFFSYHVLEITTPIHRSAKTGRNSERASPRVHLRRGHIRRLQHRKIWVSPAVVGDKSQGLVSKDYSVNTE